MGINKESTSPYGRGCHEVTGEGAGITSKKVAKQLRSINLSKAKENSLPSCPLALRTSKKAAFTLAEVLITLAIIGVVAAMTIPTLISNYQKKQTVAKLQKAYATLSNAFDLAKVENGDFSTWRWNQFEDRQEKTNYFWHHYIFPYLKVTKECFPATDGNCFATDVIYVNGKGKAINFIHAYDGSFILSDGTSVSSREGNDGITIYVDINGPTTGPNAFGNDIFRLCFTGNPLTGYTQKANNIIRPVEGTTPTAYKQPYGLSFYGEGLPAKDYLQDDLALFIESGATKMACSLSGFTCGALIKASGWKIPAGYPKLW